MTIYFSDKYICDFCPKKIETDDDGYIIYGSVCQISARGLKARVGEIPTDQNVNQLGRLQTCICRACFVKKMMPPVEFHQS